MNGRGVVTFAFALRREQQRVRFHLLGAEDAARSRQVALEPLQALTRKLLLDELRWYLRRGQFPENHVCKDRRVPVFVDRRGTRCAVAHLMDASGQDHLVRQIAKAHNYSKVRELALIPQVRSWLAAAGITLEEAARIQPEYCFQSQAEGCFCNQGGRTTIAVATIVSKDDNDVHVRVDRIEGVFPELTLNQEVTIRSSSSVGEQVLLTRDDAGLIYQISTQLKLESGEVRCQLSHATSERPVSIETVISAMRADTPAACIDVLATDDSSWNQSQCEGTDAATPDASTPDAATSTPATSQPSCGFSQNSVSIAPESITTAALLAALLLHRRKRTHSKA
ncbi:MAG TPA: hypothetical protein VHM70_32850 [Polyangiaceae bacterium]|jgi:hypothetical protein|nr:hypothetical protein [Polyangiaceae bacterium]